MTAGPIQQLFAQALSQYTGLSFTAALAWASAEVGSLNNLGIMSGGQPVAYATPQAGAAAAAQLINSSSLYAGIRASVGKSVQAQLDAIARSPWHLGPSGLAAAGGVDPYYAGVFAQYGYVPGAGGSSGTSTTSPAAGGSSGGGSFAPPPLAVAGQKTVADLLSADPPASLLTSTEIEMILGELTVSGPNDPIIASQRAYYTRYIGTPLNRVPVSGSSVFGGQLIGIDPGAIAAGIFGNFAWVPGLAIGVGVLGVVLVLGYSGLEELMG